MTDITVVPADSATYPLTLPAGGTLDFDISYQATVADPSDSHHRQAGIYLTWDDTIRTCEFGPIWVTGLVYLNPQ